MDLLAQPLTVESLSLEATKSPGPKDVILQVEEVQTPIGFLGLPREIRDQIYCIIFLADGKIPWSSPHQPPRLFGSRRDLIWAQHFPNPKHSHSRNTYSLESSL